MYTLVKKYRFWWQWLTVLGASFTGNTENVKNECMELWRGNEETCLRGFSFSLWLMWLHRPCWWILIACFVSSPRNPRESRPDSSASRFVETFCTSFVENGGELKLGFPFVKLQRECWERGVPYWIWSGVSFRGLVESQAGELIWLSASLFARSGNLTENHVVNWRMGGKAAEIEAKTWWLTLTRWKESKNLTRWMGR